MNPNHPTHFKSTIVFAPAGSGKTEELSRRYLELIRNGVKPERILTLTFTDKAAAEMKERILKNAHTYYPELYQILKENILKLRISTIHSFCLGLVQRFADLLGIDPHPGVLSDDLTLWKQAKYDTLTKIAEGEFGARTRELLISILGGAHRLDWGDLARLLDALFRKRTAVIRTDSGGKTFIPLDTNRIAQLAFELKFRTEGPALIPDYQQLFIRDYNDETEMRRVFNLLEAVKHHFLTKGNRPRKQGYSKSQQEWSSLMAEYYYQIGIALELIAFRKKFDLFKDCFLVTYEQLKREQGMVDYNDMELLALKLLTENEDWLNILYVFDEHTDHILVDEFQDTSYLQWAIIDKLTEEWRSGAGIKTELGITPSMFIVGDDKQSIYMFRDARVEIFAHARDKLAQWLGADGLEVRTLENNYRSLPAIINFNNELFSRLMQGEPNSPPWVTRYRPFICQRSQSNPGKVELLIDKADSNLNLNEARRRDAEMIARRIRLLIDSGFSIYERQPDKTELSRPCTYRDIAILVRSRNEILAALEDSLSRYQIPFLVVGGTGFYDEPEVQYLAAVTRFLIDPADDQSLYLTLRGPLFQIPENELFLAISNFSNNNGTYLWERLRAASATTSVRLQEAIHKLTQARHRVNYEPLYLILDRLLVESRAWLFFSEPQREANVRKFLQKIHELELGGQHLLRIRNFLDQPDKDEPKADVPTEEMNAVQIMTVHAAKGLQFPIVFHPGLHEKVNSTLRFHSQAAEVLIEETAFDQVHVFYLSKSEFRKRFRAYQEYQFKQIEEEKRIFYVACTRAQDALFLTGIWCDNEKYLENTKFEWLITHLGLTPAENGFKLNVTSPGIDCIAASTLPAATIPSRTSAVQGVSREKVKIAVANPPINPIARFLTQELRHNPTEALGSGEIIHRLLELISKGRLIPQTPAIEQEVRRQLISRSITGNRIPELSREITAHLDRLIASPVWEVVKPRKDAFAEFPILYHDGNRILTGRIDRIIVEPSEIQIYDYKTFPVEETDIDLLTKEYEQLQLSHYAAAIREIFPGKRVRSFVIFTHLAKIVEVDLR